LFVVSLVLSLGYLQIKPAYCEYNLATGKEELVLISSEKEVKMGASIAKRLEEKFDEDDNYTYQEKVDSIGQSIAAVCDRRDIIYHFKVLDKDFDNAFALPGGYVYLFSGLLEDMGTDEEIAAVLAHEIAHICARHSMKRLQESFGYQALRILAVKGAEDTYTLRKANEAINQLMLSYSREDELEADRLAVKYLSKAGYNTEAVIAVIDKLLKLQMDGPIRSKRHWHTHPYLAARKAAAMKEIKGQMRFDDYINITTDEGYVSGR